MLIWRVSEELKFPICYLHVFSIYRGYSFQHAKDENLLLIIDYSPGMTTTCLKKSHEFI